MSNPLRESPFIQVANVNPDDPIRYVLTCIPGLKCATAMNSNPNIISPCSVQIEQIEQLNTLLLQDIDHNFARFHDVVNNKILPQVKKYALVSQSTQEASRVSILLAERLSSNFSPAVLIPSRHTRSSGKRSSKPLPSDVLPLRAKTPTEQPTTIRNNSPTRPITRNMKRRSIKRP